MKYYLGVDIGTFETKGVITDGAGAIIASAARPHQMLVPHPGWAEHRADEDWWGDFVFVTRKMLAESRIDPSAVAGIGASGIGPCMLPVDKDGTPLMNAVLYGVDTRAAAEIEQLTAHIGPERILETCGNALTSQAVGPKILWLKNQRPELYAKTHKVLNCSSYLAFKLTGRYTIDHYSAASSAPFYDVSKLDWSDALAPGAIDMKLMPELAWTTDVVGKVTRAAAAETGLAEGTPVIAGTIDAASEALSVGVVAPGELMLMYGSTIFIILITAARVKDKRLWYAPWLFKGQHASMSGLATSGTLTHWFRNQFARELPPETAIITLSAEAAASPPGAKGLIVLPYFSGERTPIHDPAARGVIFGLDLTHQRGDVFRAILEGIAHGTRHVFETYGEAGQVPTTVYAVGGGTKNKVWAQATSDISGATQVIREKTFGASYGDALLAAIGVGDARREDIQHWNPVASRYAPDPQLRAAYEARHQVFRSLYPQTRSLMAETTLWAAAAENSARTKS